MHILQLKCLFIFGEKKLKNITALHTRSCIFVELKNAVFGYLFQRFNPAQMKPFQFLPLVKSQRAEAQLQDELLPRLLPVPRMLAARSGSNCTHSILPPLSGTRAPHGLRLLRC